MEHDMTEDIAIYEKFVGQFVNVEHTDGQKSIGILKEITSSGKLYIKGKYNSWVIDPDKIANFKARPDRFQDNGGGLNR
jgi:hypothetical protein